MLNVGDRVLAKGHWEYHENLYGKTGTIVEVNSEFINGAPLINHFVVLFDKSKDLEDEVRRLHFTYEHNFIKISSSTINII